MSRVRGRVSKLVGEGKRGAPGFAKAKRFRRRGRRGRKKPIARRRRLASTRLAISARGLENDEEQKSHPRSSLVPKSQRASFRAIAHHSRMPLAESKTNRNQAHLVNTSSHFFDQKNSFSARSPQNAAGSLMDFCHSLLYSSRDPTSALSARDLGGG